MTPFGIRKMLKSLLGMGEAEKAPAPPPVPRYKVTFELKDGTSYEADCKSTDTLVLASGRGPKPIATGCGDGTCGTCQVEVLAGADQLTPCDTHETNTKKENNVPEDYRLGCQVGVLGEGVRVKVINVLGEDFA